MSDLIRTQVLLDRKQRDDLSLIAEKEGKSFSELVRTLLEAQLRERTFAEMRLAAEQLKADYAAGADLTDMTLLDSQDFLNG